MKDIGRKLFICVTDDGIDTFANESHFWNADSSIMVTGEGIVISFNDEQKLKEDFSIEVTELTK